MKFYQPFDVNNTNWKCKLIGVFPFWHICHMKLFFLKGFLFTFFMFCLSSMSNQAGRIFKFNSFIYFSWLEDKIMFSYSSWTLELSKKGGWRFNSEENNNIIISLKHTINDFNMKQRQIIMKIFFSIILEWKTFFNYSIEIIQSKIEFKYKLNNFIQDVLN